MRVIWVLFVVVIVGAEVAFTSQIERIASSVGAGWLVTGLFVVAAVVVLGVAVTFTAWMDNDYRDFDPWAVFRRDSWRLRRPPNEKR